MQSLSKNKCEPQGAELLVRGIVQGVGFRPFVYNLASRLHISGTVSNTSVGVTIKASATKESLASFIHLLKEEAPPLSRITSLDIRPLAEQIDTGAFAILASSTKDQSRAAIPPDVALCEDCKRELLSKSDRRYRYPFINCTNCGPRFTITETTPYDRPKTSMKVFPMCPSCSDEYANPSNRRFHAQPNACHDCGPKLSWHNSKGVELTGKNPVHEAISAMQDGKVVAIRGLGGFHLTVDATSKKAVALLRKRKGRKYKPLAVMVANLETARLFCHLTEEEENTLQSPQHPILLLSRKKDTGLAPNLAPSVSDLGIMLPYTPLHHLLFQEDDCPKALVMTSGNMSGRPICTGNSQAVEHLAHIADFFLLHNREILTRVDDSVGKYIQGDMRLFRRARGYAPTPVLLPFELPPIVACGAGFKNTFCLARDTYAFPSQHIGDLFSLENYEFYTESIQHLQKVFEIEPAAVACDLHPDYMSSHHAREQSLPLYPVQHHHAHAVSVMAEHDIQEEVLAIVLDGTGYGTDGTIWGGEILRADLTSFTRLGHLEQLSLPGGDAAAHEPWRMGLSALYHTFGNDGVLGQRLPSLLKTINANKRQIVTTMLESQFNTPLTSSCGRLFDGVAALLDVQLTSHFEGQAAMKLEALAQAAMKDNWKKELLLVYSGSKAPFLEKNGEWEIITSRFVTMIMEEMAGKHSKSKLALRFHFELIQSICKLVQHLSRQTGIRKIVLSGGCMQNQILLEGFYHVLKENNFQVFTGRQIPVNDGGISFGQAIIGGLQHVSRNTHAGN